MRPRQYAFGAVDPVTGTRTHDGIAQLKTREERLRALGQVPEEYRFWVECLVKDAFQYSKARKEAIEKAVAARKAKRR
jgi:hypothetical protein